jgi:type I restriction-modification system DNA methylase subunit
MTAPKEVIEHAKKEIKRLIDNYEDLKKSGGIESFNEDETCRKFILPLFHALGWDTEGKEIIDEVTGQKLAGGQKRVDYSFNVSGQPIMFLEAKQLSADIDNPQYARQAINYGYSKTVKWVVLSDFEGIIVFNALLKLKRERISERTVLKLKYTEYLDRIDDLWLLSKESFFNDKLNKYAQSIGHITNKIPINELLLSKLLIWRNELIHKISGDNDGLSREEVAECVQRLLNRLIFIRTCEDRNIDQPNLLRNIRKEWQSSDKRLYKMLQEVFRDFDEGYDSSLFEKHLVDTIKISSDLLYDIIGGLYDDLKEDVEFDFAVIDADMLGSIYEQYLGTIQKGEGAKDKEKRKRQGIYYTPKYIVDYIVKNTLGKVLDELLKNKEYDKIGKLKVLDPACGSGSFLLKTLELFDKAYANTPEEKGFPKIRKLRALASNIYGVDLDTQAVELTKLNLLLSAVSNKRKLPNLDNNIECGNSLIDDPRVAGDKAFDWNKRFKDVMNNGGFDVIVGNPPYVQLSMEGNLLQQTKDYLLKRYSSSMGRLNTFGFFIKLGIDLLNDDGYLSFIIPNTMLTQDYYEELRKIILDSCSIDSIV